MRAFALSAFGDTGSLREFDMPHPDALQVRVKVAGASINPVDWKSGKGYLKDFLEHRFPFVTGQDMAGEVDAVGAHVHDLKEGDAVFGCTGLAFFGRGTHADYVIVSSAAVAPKPRALSGPEAASLPLAAVTAMMCMEAAEVRPGDVVVIVGAAGGVGSFAVQLAAARGARPIAVARTANHDYVRRLGAAEVVDYEKGDLSELVRGVHPGSLDAIIDLVGDAEAIRRLAVGLRDGGAVASPVGSAPMDDPRIKGFFVTAQVTRDRLEQISSWLADGTLVLPEIRTYPLEEVGAAFRESESGHVRGKLVVVP